MRATHLYIYPVKSLGGCEVDSTDVDALGFAGDRRFLVVDQHGKFLTQRSHPRMALISPTLSDRTLTLRSATGGSVSVHREPDTGAPVRTVSIWKSEGLLAEDCGDEPADWLSDFPQLRCRLVRIGPKFTRPVLKQAAGPGDQVHFADAVPFLIIGQATLDHLNDRLTEQQEPAVPMERFRPNLVFEGGAPHVEDTWTRIRIGSVVFRAAGNCARCIIPTIDQQTAERGHEPLRTLATYRRSASDPSDVHFGQNLIHETKSGTVRVGDSIELLA